MSEFSRIAAEVGQLRSELHQVAAAARAGDDVLARAIRRGRVEATAAAHEEAWTRLTPDVALLRWRPRPGNAPQTPDLSGSLVARLRQGDPVADTLSGSESWSASNLIGNPMLESSNPNYLNIPITPILSWSTGFWTQRVLNSGTSPTFTRVALYDRTDGNTLFNSSTAEIDVEAGVPFDETIVFKSDGWFPAEGADNYFPYLAASVRIAGPVSWAGHHTKFSVKLRLGSTYDAHAHESFVESPVMNLLDFDDTEQFTLTAVMARPGGGYVEHWWQLEFTVASNWTGATATASCYFGEPMLAMSMSESAPSFTPILGSWTPDRIYAQVAPNLYPSVGLDATGVHLGDGNAPFDSDSVQLVRSDSASVLGIVARAAYSEVAAAVDLMAGSAPVTPLTGRGRVYFSAATKTLHSVNDAGVDTDLAAGGGGPATQVSMDTAASGAADYVARIKLAGDTTYRLAVGLSSADFGTIYFGAGGVAAEDAALVRSGAGIVDVTANGSANTTRLRAMATAGQWSQVTGQITGEAAPRFALYAGSSLTAGLLLSDGTAAGSDVLVQRTAAGQLTVGGNGQAVNSSARVMATAGQRSGLVLSVVGDANARTQLWGDATQAGINFGPGTGAADLRIYRNNGGTPIIDANGTANGTNLAIRSTAGQQSQMQVDVTGDTQPRAILKGDANMIGMILGPGNAAQDVRLYRTGSKTLSLDDNAAGAATLTITSTGTVNWGGAGTLDVNNAKLRLPTAAGISLTATESYVGEDSTTHDVLFYDSQRSRVAGEVGWAPYATSIGAIFTTAPTTTAVTLAASGGSVAIPVQVVGHMLLQDIRFYIGASTTPTYELQVYRQYLNNGNAGENTLAYVSGAKRAAAAGTASAINTATMVGAPVYLSPGLYWVVIRNTTVNTIIIGGIATATWAVDMSQTKTLGSTIVDANLDFVAATWTKVTGFVIPIRFSGRVFGQTAAF